MKKISLLIVLGVCGAFGLMPGSSYAQDVDRNQAVGRTLTDAQLDAIVKPSLAQCQANSNRIDAASIIPTRNAKEFPNNKIANTLHGIWQGRIIGDDKDLGVDYFWIFDTIRNEALIIALRNGKQSVASPRNAATAPKLAFLLCAKEGYVPAKVSPQIQEFVKVFDGLDAAPGIVQKATGVKVRKARPTLADLWQGLLASKYFESMPAVAFAGGFFKPIQIARVANAVGPAGLSLKWNAEYRGGGATSIKYVTGLPMTGVEHGEFIGTTTRAGDYVVSTPGNGKIWKVEASLATSRMPNEDEARTFPVVCYDLAFDSVTLGPLQDNNRERSARGSIRQKRK